MCAIELAAIADDFTGGSDLAGMLYEGGARTVLLFSGNVPVNLCAQAVVLCLKSRSAPVEEARSMVRQALAALKPLEPKRWQFKYCSTFDSTRQGNIGPVLEEMLAFTRAERTVAVPALPVNGRTQYLGHLFVNGVLLNESPMKDHPLNPMDDPNLVRFLQHQTRLPVGLIPLNIVREGVAAIEESLKRQEARILLVDAIEEIDLLAIAAAVAQDTLTSGGSGLGRYLPKFWPPAEDDARTADAASRPTLILSGSCSAATLAQLAQFPYPVFPLETSTTEAQAYLDRHQVLVISSSAPPDQRDRSAGASQRIEQRLAGWARRAVEEWGVRQMIVAGGESSGAVVSALGVSAAQVAGVISPGVPALVSLDPPGLRLTLKSGNFGGANFFTEARNFLNGI